MICPVCNSDLSEEDLLNASEIEEKRKQEEKEQNRITGWGILIGFAVFGLMYLFESSGGQQLGLAIGLMVGWVFGRSLC